MRKPSRPGEIIQNLILSPLNISHIEAAQKMEIEPEVLHEVIQGLQPITHTLARALSEHFGSSPRVWMKLQENYDKSTRRTRS